MKGLHKISTFILLGIFTMALIPHNFNMPLNEAITVIARSSVFAKAFDDVPGHGLADKFSLNLDVDTGGYETVSAQGGTFVIPSTVETLNVVSSDANDTLAGTGARNIYLTCLDSDGKAVQFIVNMNGTSAVTTTQTCAFVNRAAVYFTGTGNKNAGNITITNTTSGQTLAYIPAGYSVTQQSPLKVPSDEQWFIKSIRIGTVKTGGGSSPKVKFQGVVYSETTGTEYIIFEDVIDASVSNYRNVEDFKAQPLLSNEVFFVQATTDTNNTEVFYRAFFETRKTSN